RLGNRERLRTARHPRRERGRRRLWSLPRARTRLPRRDDRRQREGHALRRARRPAASARERRGGHRHARVGSGPPWYSLRGRLLLLEVRSGRVHACARQRVAGTRGPVHECLPGRGRHGLRARTRTRAHAGCARRDDERGRRRRRRPLRGHQAAQPSNSRDRAPPADGGVMGVNAPVRWGILSTAHINRKVIPAVHASEETELLAVASRDQARAEEYAREWKIERAYGSYKALLEDADVD